jgi:homospermidine synthase
MLVYRSVDIDHFTFAMAKTQFDGQVLVLGLGSIASGTLPLILEHIDIPPSRMQVVAKSTDFEDRTKELGIKYSQANLTPDNYRDLLVNRFRLSSGDFLVNLSVDVSSKDLIMLCHTIGALYIDTCIEPWLGGYEESSLSWSERSNYALREGVRNEIPNLAHGPTAIVAHGANPGLVNHFVKRALSELCEILTGNRPRPANRSGWATLSRDLGVKAIQISERDTQRPKVQKRRNEFVNTWSVDGFIAEGIHQPSELGWGSHEQKLPEGALHHEFGSQCAIYFEKPGGAIKVRGWTPLEGPYHGFMVTHNESIGLADYLTIRDSDGNVIYRPTSYYCYHPCDAAVLSVHEILGRGKDQDGKRLLQADDIEDGVDELGVLLLGDFGTEFSGYWHGSRLAHEDAKKVRYNQATTLQVTAAVVAGMIWAIEHPREGIVEPDEMDYERVLEISDPYTGPIVSTRTSWNPAGKEFQFSKFLVN